MTTDCKMGNIYVGGCAEPCCFRKGLNRCSSCKKRVCDEHLFIEGEKIICLTCYEND